MQHIPMSKIPHFDNIKKIITRMCRYIGKDENDLPIYNEDTLPIIQAYGTTKLHGTCGMVCYNDSEGIWVQSKNNIITILHDNAEFANFVDQNYKMFLDIMHEFKKVYNVDTKENTISIFGEWAGEGIQAGVAICKLEKKFYIFGGKITPNDTELSAYWVPSDIFNLKEYDNIYHVKNFKRFSIDINFEETDIAKEDLKILVDEVEKECPVAKHFGISGIGEGIVFTLYYKGIKLRFKAKGIKHSGQKKIRINKSKNVDQELVNKVVLQITVNRLEQMVQESFDVLNGGDICIEGMGKYLKAVKEDIIAEDMDIIRDAGLTMKNINKTLHQVARDYLLDRLII